MPVKEEIKLSQLSYVILYVKDTDKALSFYRDILGLKVKTNEQGWVEFETGATTLALHQEDKEVNADKKGSGQATMVFNVDDIYAAYEFFKGRGVKFISEPHAVCEAGDKVGTSVDFTDADGNLLSLFGLVLKKK